jgi:hypothetical protein
MITYNINLFAAPSSGKTTVGYKLAGHLKEICINAELATEFAKDVVHERTTEIFTDQLYVMAVQNHRVHILGNDVEYIITDSPILQSLAYIDPEDNALRNLILDRHHKQTNINIFIDPVSEYNPVGRTQTAEEAAELHKEILHIVWNNDGVDFHTTKNTCPSVVYRKIQESIQQNHA